jgi:DNA-directed RNA polymerase specialized sigma24 family protein
MGDQQSELRQLDWNDLYPRLVLAARGMVKGRANAQELAADLAQEAVMKAFAEERRWKSDQISAYHYLCGIMRSLLSHRERSYERLHAEELSDDKVVRLADFNPSAEAVAVFRSQKRDLLGFVQQRNPRAALLATFMLDHGLQTSKELSNAIGITVTGVEHLRKALRTLISDYKRLNGMASESPAARVLTKLTGGSNDR